MEWITTNSAGCDRIAIIDFETTGLEPKNERIIQIGVAVAHFDGTLIDTWTTLVNPNGHPINPEAQKVNGLTPEELTRNGLLFADCASTLESITQNAYVLAHGLPFDATFWWMECARNGIIPPQRAGLCTKLVAWRQTSGIVSSLRSSIKHFRVDVSNLNIDSDSRHDALHDALALLSLYTHFVGEHSLETLVEQHNQVITNPELFKMAVPALRQQAISIYESAAVNGSPTSN